MKNATTEINFRKLQKNPGNDEFKTREDIFKTFFVGANDIIISIDRKGKIMYVNPAWIKALDYSLKEAKQISFDDILISTQIPYWHKALDRIVAGKNLKKYKTIFVSKNGSKMFVEGSLSTQVENGKIISIWGIFRDTSKFRRNQDQLQEMYESLKKRRFELEALKSLSDRLTNIFTIEEAIMSINSYLAEILNFSTATYLVINPTEEGGYFYTTFIREDVGKIYLDAARKDIIDFLKHKKGRELKNALAVVKHTDPQITGLKLSPDNKTRLGSKTIFPLEIGNSLLGIIQVSSNKSKLFVDRGWLTDAMLVTFILFVVRIQTLIRSQRSRTESLVEGLSDGVIMFNKYTNIILMNPVAVFYTGLSLESFALADFYKLFPDVELSKKVNEMFNKKKIIKIKEAKLDNSFFELILTPVKDNEGKIISGAIIMHDITSLKEVDHMKTEFVSFASHQLRTPLTGIKWFSRLLLKNKAGELNAKQRDFIEQISLTNSRMIKLVTDLLDVSRIELGKKFNIEKGTVTLSSIIEKIIEEYVLLANEKKIKVANTTTPLSNAKLVVDSIKIVNAIGNLVSNAIKYTPEGGSVEIGCNLKNDRIIIFVKDNGIGIPEKQQPEIFKKFFRADNARDKDSNGTGLGLYLAKSIIEAHSGKIWFKSGENRGTTFLVSLPY